MSPDLWTLIIKKYKPIGQMGSDQSIIGSSSMWGEVKMKSKKKILKVVVNRKKWARGGEGGNSSLLNTRGNMCCLGFAAMATGKVKRKDIRDRGGPEDLDVDLFYGNKHPLPQLLTRRRSNNKTCTALIEVNDSCPENDPSDIPFLDRPILKGSVRESRIKALGKKVGIAFTFKG